jgi:O-antigen/teichoic acid export membrane protein
VYGIFTVFNSILSLVGASASLSYHQALVLPKTEAEFHALLRVTLRTTFFITVILQLLFLMLSDSVVRWTDTRELGFWIHFIPSLGLLLAFDQIIQRWSVRQRAFRASSATGVAVMLLPKLFNVGYGKWVHAGPEGLVMTSALQFLLRIVLFPWLVLKGVKEALFARVSRDERKGARKEYSDYGRYVFWGNMLNLGSAYLVPLMLPFFAISAQNIGYYSYALVVLDLPIRLLGAGIAPVFLQRGVELRESNPKELGEKTWDLFRTLSFVFLPMLTLLVFFGEPMFSIAFGDNWSEAGKVAALLGTGYLFRYVTNPISSVFNIVRKERELAGFQVILFVLRLLGLIIPAVMGLSFVHIMAGFAAGNALSYFLYGYRIFGLLGISSARYLRFSLVALIIPAACGMLYLLLF